MSDLNLNAALSTALWSVTKSFVRKKYATRGRYLTDREAASLRAGEKREEKNEIKAAAYEFMAYAYNLVSDNGKLPANARQIMYQARPRVLEATNGKCWKDANYFTQTLLPEYQSEHPEETADWDVTYDARGHFAEPHVRHKLGIGTLEVRSYIKSWAAVTDALKMDIDKLYSTSGPKNRFNFALFIEKEGFDPLLNRSEIAKKYDLATFSSKGQSQVATRQLLDALSQKGVTILVAHDFDTCGLSITHNLFHDTPRYKFTVEPNVIDIGLRLTDVKRMNLQSEPVDFAQMKNPGEKLLDYDDVTQEEIDFLIEKQVNEKLWLGKRVELNAMTSLEFITWLEAKLKEHGVKKVIPDQQTLGAAWQRANHVSRIEDAIEEIEEELDSADPIPMPKDLAARVRKLLRQEPELSWDEALIRIADKEREKG